MLYTEADRKEHIKELQQYLRTIARYEGKSPLLLPDGIFGPETTAAIENFQQNNSLPSTGAVDKETWNAIRERHRTLVRENAPALSIDVFPSKDFILHKGAVGDIVIFLQLMLVAVSNIFHNIPAISVNGIFDTATEDAVKKVQSVSALVKNGIVNKLTWNAIVLLYNTHGKAVFPAETK